MAANGKKEMAPKLSSLGVLFSSENCNWKVRADFDLAQRCLFIVLASYVSCGLIGWIPVVNWILTPTVLVLITMAALAAAVVKSSAQLKPERKAVLITGERLTV